MCTRMQRFTTGKEHNPCLVWKEKPIFLIPNRREFPVQFAAPVLDKTQDWCWTGTEKCTGNCSL